MIYCMTICGNLLIITLVSYSKTLHTPMYLFISHLSILDILLATIIVPNLLHSLLVSKFIMPFYLCFTQLFFYGVSETSECILLTVMCYDRYLAICRPLHYALLMNRSVCWTLVVTSWTSSILIIFIYVFILSKLQFPGPAIIDHFFCYFDPILEISPTDSTILKLTQKILSIIFLITPFSVIVVSYIYIIVTIFKMSSISGRQKVFSTCSSHITVVSIYYGTLINTYIVSNRGQLHKMTKFLSLSYTVVTTLLNPLSHAHIFCELYLVLGLLCFDCTVVKLKASMSTDDAHGVIFI
ncbi:olfactory receptor 10A7-like [Gastrophryne carolinensis]